MKTRNRLISAFLVTYCLLVPGNPSSLALQVRTNSQDGEQLSNVTSVSPRTTSPQPAVPADVIIGAPRPIPYSRAFPLLDGLFQDVSAIQLTQLQLNANQANASNIDAIIQQFQASLQYSQTLGLQNAAAAQQSAAFSASGALQTQLLNQASQLINLQLGAQQQVGQAQIALNSLPSSSTIEQKAAAQQAVTTATDNLNAINAQVTNVKSLMSTSAPSAPTYSAPAPSPPTFPTPPVTITIPSAGGTPPFSPSFPSSKQMENQVNLLWERLAHLVNTLAQSENPNGISLVRFHTSILNGKTDRKRKLLSTQYSLRCSASGKVPQVLDLFPRNAAVNITNMKYRDSRLSLGGLLSFFSIGGNAAYNREHLRITQSLGQSAYITGFGIETKSFGWVFSPALAEDVVAPGDRTTFALVAAPRDCGDVSVDLVNAIWDKRPVVVSEDHDSIKRFDSWAAEPELKKLCSKCIDRLAYAPVDFDSANPGSVTVNLKLNFDLDREQTITANGIVLRRARDNYGRATSAGGSGGLLQSTSFEAGTWIPVNSRELVLQLNPAVFARRFPTIMLTSPKGTIDISQEISDANEIEVAGLKYTCPTGGSKSACASAIPPIGRLRAMARNFAVARWVGSKKFIITLQQTPTAAANSVVSGTLPAVQVITGSRNQPWSGYAKVVASQGGPNVPLECSPLGERLLCDVGQLDKEKRTDFDIFDGEFSGGPIRGSGVLSPCSGGDCSDPLIWEMDPPKWDKQTSAWVFRLSLINVRDAQVAYLDKAFQGEIDCSDENLPCRVEISLPMAKFALVRDSMALQIYEPPVPPSLLAARVGNPSTIGNLRIQVSPILSSITDDQTRFSGQNLVFEKMQIGAEGRTIKLDCSEALDCFIRSPGFKPQDEGYLYFVTGSQNQTFPFMLITEKGLQVVAPHKPKPAASPAAAAAASSSPTPPTQTQTLQIQINPSTRLYSRKDEQ